MTEEQKPETKEPKEPTGPSNSDIRKSELFKSVTSKQSEDMASLQEKFDALQQSIVDGKEAARVAALEDAGNYEQLKAEQAARLEAMETSHKRELAELNLKAMLAGAMHGDNDVWLRGALSMYDGGDPADFIATLKEDERNAPIFSGPAPTGHPATDTAIPSAPGQKLNGKQIAAMSQSKDPEQRKQATDYKREYYKAHGSLEGLLD